MPKNTNKTKNNNKKTTRNWTNFDLTTDSLIEKYQPISIKFKICIFQLIDDIELRKQSLNQIRNCLTGHI